MCATCDMRAISFWHACITYAIQSPPVPQQPVVRVYSVPQDAFESSDESSESGGDSGESGDEGRRSVNPLAVGQQPFLPLFCIKLWLHITSMFFCFLVAAKASWTPAHVHVVQLHHNVATLSSLCIIILALWLSKWIIYCPVYTLADGREETASIIKKPT